MSLKKKQRKLLSIPSFPASGEIFYQEHFTHGLNFTHWLDDHFFKVHTNIMKPEKKISKMDLSQSTARAPVRHSRLHCTEPAPDAHTSGPGAGHVDTGHPPRQTSLLPSSVQNELSNLTTETIQVMTGVVGVVVVLLFLSRITLRFFLHIVSIGLKEGRVALAVVGLRPVPSYAKLLLESLHL